MDVMNYFAKKSKDSKWIHMMNESEAAFKGTQQKRAEAASDRRKLGCMKVECQRAENTIILLI